MTCLSFGTQVRWMSQRFEHACSHIFNPLYFTCFFQFTFLLSVSVFNVNIEIRFLLSFFKFCCNLLIEIFLNKPMTHTDKTTWVQLCPKFIYTFRIIFWIIVQTKSTRPFLLKKILVFALQQPKNWN